MIAASIAATSLTPNDQDNEGEQSPPVLADARKRTGAWVQKAVSRYEVAKQAAAAIGVNPPYLTAQTQGAKPFNLTHAELMRLDNPAAYCSLVEEMAVAGSMIVIPRREVQLSADEIKVLRESRRVLGAMWGGYRDQMAARIYRCTGDLVDVLLDEHERMGK